MSKLKIAVQMDPPGLLDKDSDSTLALIEEAIRSMSEQDENGERRLERLERFNTVCPYF